ncbi:MAG: HdeA/HdeB family chaperone [Methylococcales bacterium]|jgi:acid stress chaperone HdeA|nr:HdeA/HdeB family chaperone [Methylococcales bacterium]
MNTKKLTIGITSVILLAASTLGFATDTAKVETSKVEAPKADSSKKPLGKLTCEDFIAVEDIIKPQYVIAGNAYTKGGKAKNAVIEVIDTETLVPILVEECQKAPKESFWAKLKSKLKL